MAQRFGGDFSPNGKPASPAGSGAKATPNAFAGKSRSRMGARSTLLFLAPFPLLFTAFFSGAVGMAVDLAAFAVLMLAAWLTREGLRAQDAWHARKVARRPALPRKMLGSALTGLGLALAAFAPDASLLNPVIYGVLGAALHLFSFGLDPMKDKGMEGIDTFQQDRVAKAVAEAETHLRAMSDAILRAGDRSLVDRIARFQSTAREMFRAVEEDPRDLTAARKYLGVYLQGTRDATSKFADLYARGADPQVRADYESLLDDLETNFSRQTEKMLLDDRTDLDVEIDVLRDRLQREGVRIE